MRKIIAISSIFVFAGMTNSDLKPVREMPPLDQQAVASFILEAKLDTWQEDRCRLEAMKVKMLYGLNEDLKDAYFQKCVAQQKERDWEGYPEYLRHHIQSCAISFEEIRRCFDIFAEYKRRTHEAFVDLNNPERSLLDAKKTFDHVDAIRKAANECTELWDEHQLLPLPMRP